MEELQRMGHNGDAFSCGFVLGVDTSGLVRREGKGWDDGGKKRMYEPLVQSDVHKAKEKVQHTK